MFRASQMKRSIEPEKQEAMSAESQQSSIEKKGPFSMTSKPIRCDAEHCGRPAMSTVELHFYCVDHFISYSYERLNQCRPIPFLDQDDDGININERFLQQCSDQAVKLLCPMLGLDNLDRARLFDILLWASELVTTRKVFECRQMAHH
jgi:hypothetical protein